MIGKLYFDCSGFLRLNYVDSGLIRTQLCFPGGKKMHMLKLASKCLLNELEDRSVYEQAGIQLRDASLGV